MQRILGGALISARLKRRGGDIGESVQTQNPIKLVNFHSALTSANRTKPGFPNEDPKLSSSHFSPLAL